MRAIVVRDENDLNIQFDECMCVDTSIVPDFSEYVLNIYKNHLCSCIDNMAIQSIECQITNLLQRCSSIGALYTGAQYMFLKDKPNMFCLYNYESRFVFKNIFKRQISKFQFVFGSCNG